MRRAQLSDRCRLDEGPRLAQLPEPDDNGLAMLDRAAADVRPKSRLACQINASGKNDGLVASYPKLSGRRKA
jgi:ferredoxin